MAARRKSEDREPDSVGPSDRNAALAALADKGVVQDAARENPKPSLPALTGVVHDLGGDVRAVLTAPSMVLRETGDDGKVTRRRFVYRGDVVKATASFVDDRDHLVRL